MSFREALTNSERREISNDQIFKTLRSARDSLFKAGNKNSFDMSSGGPKDHFLRFFWESEVFFEEGPFFATPICSSHVCANLMKNFLPLLNRPARYGPFLPKFWTAL